MLLKHSLASSWGRAWYIKADQSKSDIEKEEEEERGLDFFF